MSARSADQRQSLWGGPGNVREEWTYFLRQSLATFFNFRFAMPETGSIVDRDRTQASVSVASREQLLQTDALLLLNPGIRQSPSKTGDGKVRRRGALNDRRDDPGRHKGEGSQQANMPFALAFLLCDLGE